MSVSYIGIGSNLGNRHKNCLHAIELLEIRGIKVKKKSSMYETGPWGVKDQPRFINMVIQIETSLMPHELLGVLKDIEKEIGRKDSFHWGPRIIDLDILLFNEIVMNDKKLQIPHPYLHEREFVLRPLDEIAPDVIHPVLNMSINKLAHKMLRDRDAC